MVGSLAWDHWQLSISKIEVGYRAFMFDGFALRVDDAKCLVERLVLGL